jgi:hypothetical protein
MINVKSLVQHVNPVPDPPTNGMSARARDELAELIGSDLVEAVETKRRGPARRPSRRGVLVAAVACTAAAVVAGVAVFALNDPKEPGGGGGRAVLQDDRRAGVRFGPDRPRAAGRRARGDVRRPHRDRRHG